ncbi:MAG: hypothetical protein ACKVH8_12770 [Pirellulales bacterium]|jgi:hypothetical protein
MKKRLLTVCTLAVSCILLSSAVKADGGGTLIFEDDFERNESQETKDEIGKGWGSNSKSRAAGNKQVDLKNGAMYIYRHKVADHGVSVTHDAEFENGSVEFRFMLENASDTLALDFADAKFKEVHAGHLIKATIGIKKVDLADLKTGVMNSQIRELKLADKLTSDHKAMLKTKTKRFPVNLKTGKWYAAVVSIHGETLSLSIDGKQVGSFSSSGIAHPTKRMLRLAVPKNAVVDDLKIYALSTAGK